MRFVRRPLPARHLSAAEWSHRTDAALAWLRQSILATGNQGSAHSWHPLLGWAKAYPETTGYLIETLLDYAKEKQDDTLRQLASDSARWLETLQLPGGAFPGLLAGNTKPSVFNTSQILFGLMRVTPPPTPPPGGRGAVMPSPSAMPSPFLPEGGFGVAHHALTWLLSELSPDYAWRSHAFVPGFVPSYYTRSIWGVLCANDRLQNPEVEAKMRAALHFYADFFQPNGTVRDWGFRPGQTAFTHTMAYTVEGFLESALRLGEQAILEKTIDSATQFLEVRAAAGGRTAGRYDADWRGDYSFVCVTGNCQWSVVCHKIWQLTGEPAFLAAAHGFLAEVIDFQKMGSNKNTRGALPGSAPFWGAYLPFRYPNWAAKFFLDAMLRLKP